jgi:hypothetical protein
MKKTQGGLHMDKTLNILICALIAAAGLQIAGVNFLIRGSNYTALLKGVDLTAMQTAFNLLPFLF